MAGPKGGPKGHNGPPKPKNTKSTFLRLLGYLGKSKKLLFIVFMPP